MSYIGKGLLHGSYIHDSFNGDGSTVNFTLSTSPGSANALLVMVDNVLQSPSAFSVDGTTLTFSSAPASGTNNINVWIMGRELDIGKPAAGTVGQTEIDTTSLSPIVQVVHVEDVTASTGTGTIPADDTLPQNTEGDEWQTLTITPKNANNKLLIEWNIQIYHTAAGNRTAALFKDSGADALAVSVMYTVAGSLLDLHGSTMITAGSTSAMTFKIRVGNSNAGTWTLNGVTGTRQYGGALSSSFRITEIAQ